MIDGSTGALVSLALRLWASIWACSCLRLIWMLICCFAWLAIEVLKLLTISSVRSERLMSVLGYWMRIFWTADNTTRLSSTEAKMDCRAYEQPRINYVENGNWYLPMMFCRTTRWSMSIALFESSTACWIILTKTCVSLICLVTMAMTSPFVMDRAAAAISISRASTTNGLSLKLIWSVSWDASKFCVKVSKIDAI